MSSANIRNFAETVDRETDGRGVALITADGVSIMFLFFQFRLFLSNTLAFFITVLFVFGMLHF